jgi:hypothetical protein
MPGLVRVWLAGALLLASAGVASAGGTWTIWVRGAQPGAWEPLTTYATPQLCFRAEERRAQSRYPPAENAYTSLGLCMPANSDPRNIKASEWFPTTKPNRWLLTSLWGGGPLSVHAYGQDCFRALQARTRTLRELLTRERDAGNPPAELATALICVPETDTVDSRGVKR